MNILSAIEKRSEQNRENFALLAFARKPLTYSRLLTHSYRVVADLNNARISRGDRVAVVLPNGPEMAACLLAVVTGASCAPLNPLYRRSEFDYYLSALEARVLIVREGADSPAIEAAHARGIRVIWLKPELDDAAGIFTLDLEPAPADFLPVLAQPEDEALVLFTSGTTARPKMVPLTQANLAASIDNIVATLDLTPCDRCLNVMPLFHVNGLIGVLFASLAAGASVVCTPGFNAPHFFDWCREFEPTWYSAVPAMHRSLLVRAREQPEQAANLRFRFIRSGAAPLPVGLMTEMERVFEVPVIEGYGLTETAQQVSVNPLPPGLRKPGSVGIPGRTNVGIIGENGNLLESGQTGEIVVQGPAVLAGYAKNPTANRQSFFNGWFRTGDEGRLDVDGYLYITGRIKEVINRGGQKISPREIDEVLSAHPAVAEAVAFPVPDSRLGEDIAAAVVLRAKDSTTEHALRTFVADKVADYKVPRQIYFFDQIPTGPTGKLQRVDLATELGLVIGNSSESLSRAPYVAPSTETQKALVEIWTSVLGVEHIGIHDHFVALGGDSLLLAQLTLPMQKAGWPNITVLTFFERPTIAGLAELIDSEADAASRRIDVRTPEPDNPAEPALTWMNEASWAGVGERGDVAVTHWPIQPLGTRPPLYVMGSFNAFAALGRRLGLDQPVLGVAVPNELKLRMPYRVEDMAAAQVESILKSQSSGPCYLAGFSAEGVLAYEVAQQLATKGREVRLVILVDTSCPAEPDPLLIRMIRNAGIHISNVSRGGMEQLRLAIEGIVRRLILRLRIHSWRLAHQLGIAVARPAPRAPMDVLVANAIATRTYVPRTYTGRVLLFKRTRDLIGRYRRPDNGWGRVVVRGGLEVYPIEGDHFSLLAEPGVEALAQKIAEAMGIQRDEPIFHRPAADASRTWDKSRAEKNRAI